MAAIRENVLTVIGAGIENVPWRRGISHCYQCTERCRKGLLSKIKPYGFTVFMKRYGEEQLMNCLERNALKGVVYHRDGLNGDNDDFQEVEELISFIQTGGL